jgi:1-acyl-sn-glycerol-3-phosphate acyltransferase
MMFEIWKRRRLAVRGLGEHGHYAVPVWRELLGLSGVVRGTRDNVRALTRERQTILVFSGGAREVNKRRGQYQLRWTEHIGFARLAIEQGYPVVPFAAVVRRGDARRGERPGHTGLRVGSRRPTRSSWLPDAPDRPRRRAHPIPSPERVYFWFGELIASRGSGTASDGARRDHAESVTTPHPLRCDARAITHPKEVRDGVV